jgi:hypothetical protein
MIHADTRGRHLPRARTLRRDRAAGGARRGARGEAREGQPQLVELFEAAVLWNGKVCLLTTDNHGNVHRGGGAFWQSDDGLTFRRPAMGYGKLRMHVSMEQYPSTHGVKDKPARGKGKMVRPQILVEDGRPAWLYCPSTNCYEGRKYSDCLVFKILTDEEVIAARGKKGAMDGDER